MSLVPQWGLLLCWEVLAAVGFGAVILDLSLPFFPGVWMIKWGMEMRGAFLGCRGGRVLVCLTEPPPGAGSHVLTPRGWREVLPHLKLCPGLGQC